MPWEQKNSDLWEICLQEPGLQKTPEKGAVKALQAKAQFHRFKNFENQLRLEASQQVRFTV